MSELDLNDYWQKSIRGENNLPKINWKKLANKTSNQPLQVLKKHLNANLYYGVILTIAYAVIIVMYPIWQVQIALAILIAFNVWFLYSGWNYRQKLKQYQLQDQGLLQQLKVLTQNFQTWLKLSERIAVFIYPVGVTGGFLLGGVLGSGSTVGEFLSIGFVQIALVICLVVLTPLSYLLARKLNHIAFGKYLQKISTMIEELENES
ncbi:MAG: hypothetical protein JJU02_13630 [Cryomorphaceae bacterium]|nr:hypothetical protein [Cryomorphaceae bacterium]